MKLKKNLTVGIFAVVLAVAAWVLSYSQVDMGLYNPDDLGISPATYPRFAAALLGVFGLCNIIKSLVFKQEDYVELNLKQEAKVLAMFLLGFVYLFLFSKIGFIIDTTLYVWFVLLLEGSKKKSYYLILFVMVVVVFLGFRYGMGISKLPWGVPLKYIFGGV